MYVVAQDTYWRHYDWLDAKHHDIEDAVPRPEPNPASSFARLGRPPTPTPPRPQTERPHDATPRGKSSKKGSVDALESSDRYLGR